MVRQVTMFQNGANSRAIITGKDSKYNSVDDLKGTTFGISRLGR
jgi:ABC-type nitrate/sulfonate/bicarbonate transport system substrate-binding protein